MSLSEDDASSLNRLIDSALMAWAYPYVRSRWFSKGARPTVAISLRSPVIVALLAATAIPIELRPPSQARLSLDFGLSHFLVNVLGYLPLGIVLGDLEFFWAVTTASLISAFAETSQFGMMYRDPSVADFVANVLGAILGIAIVKRWRVGSLAFGINSWSRFGAAILALTIVLWAWARAGTPVNPRGWASPGVLEAQWKLDENQGRAAQDSSGNDLNGIFSDEPAHAAGPIGSAAVFDGRKVYLDCGRRVALRLPGSMTITAWIKSSSFPVDDAAIVSQFDHELGYQLDTTVDSGQRTVGFKLTNSCGELMARYGSTPLVLNNWYHVAGVYDAAAKTINVYLNGELDNGLLRGFVTETQRPSRAEVYIGRRSDLQGFEFAGLISDVHIYSLALSGDEVAAVMRGQAIGRASARGSRSGSGIRRSKNTATPCAAFSEYYDIEMPLAAAAVGMFATVVFVGLWPVAKPALYVVPGFVAGLLLLAGIAFDLPSMDLVLIPLTSLAGSVSVVLSTGPISQSG